MSGYALTRAHAIDAANGIRPNQITAMIMAAKTASEVHDIKARVEAARAWARAHKRIKDVRLDLLRVEMAALKRIAEFGAYELLSGGDKEAARWLSTATDAEIEQALELSQQATTAASVVRRAREFEHIRRRTSAGEQYAEDPVPSDGFAGLSDEDLAEARRRDVAVIGVLNNLVEQYTRVGTEFTIDELVDAVLDDAAVPEESRATKAFRKGVEKACRKAVSNAVPPKLGPTPIPRILTCRSPEGGYIRIPTVNAKLPHLDDMIAIRQAELARAKESIDQLVDIRERLEGLLGHRDRDVTPIRELLFSADTATEEAS